MMAMLTVFLILLPTAISLARTLPVSVFFSLKFFISRGQGYILIFYIYFVPVCYILLFIAAFMDPGIIPRKVSLSLATLLEMVL